jgi:hypothetical protein
MRNFIILLMFCLLLVRIADAQPNKNGVIYRGVQNFYPCIDVGVGYIADHKYEKFTISTTINNFYLRRFGAFTMIELDWTAPAVVMGPTVSIYDFAYIWGGMDFFTSRGFFARGGFEHARKDIGIGFYPFRWATVKIAHSFNAGSRVEIGVRIPFKNEPVYLRDFTR